MPGFRCGSRSPSYWQYLILRHPEDEFHYVEAAGQRMGYFRTALTAEELKIRDFALLESGDEAGRALVAGVTALAHARGVNRVGGWMPATEAFREQFRVSDRSRELTMVKPLVPRLSIGAAHRAAGEYLHEIDHV